MAILWLLVLGCTNEPEGAVTIQISSAERGAVVVRVHNETHSDIVLLSPASPSRSIDESNCTLSISTKIADTDLYYAFTPTLELVSAGAERTFRAELEPVLLTDVCDFWKIEAEYAYVTPEVVGAFSPKQYEEFHHQVLLVQQVTKASATVVVESRKPRAR